MNTLIRRVGNLVTILVLSFGSTQSAYPQIIFTDSFEFNASPLWGNNVGSWSVFNGAYYATTPSAFPNAHSSLSTNLEDFYLDVDIHQPEIGGIWLRSSSCPGSPTGRKGILLMATGGLMYWHAVTEGPDYGNNLNVNLTAYSPGSSNLHLHVEVSGKTFSAFVNGSRSPVTTLTLGSNAFVNATSSTSPVPDVFPNGEIALYSDSDQSFDNLELGFLPPVLMIAPAVELSWRSRPNTLYQLQRRQSLDSNSWADWNAPLLGNGMVLNAFDSTASPDLRLYRLKILP
jgi:hypothetical protein